MENNKLTVAQERHKAFAAAYLANGMNGTQAYKTIYPKASEDTARANATKLLADTHIQSILATQKEKTAEKLEITKESLIQDLLDIKQTNMYAERGGMTAIKAIETINKMLGFNAVDKKEIEHKGGIVWNEQKTYLEEK